MSSGALTLVSVGAAEASESRTQLPNHAISMGCDPVRLGRNLETWRTFTKRLNLAAKAHVQDSDVVSVDSEASSRIRKPFAGMWSRFRTVHGLATTSRYRMGVAPSTPTWTAPAFGVRLPVACWVRHLSVKREWTGLALWDATTKVGC